MSRRKILVLSAAALATAALALGGWVFWYEQATLTVQEERIDLPGPAAAPLRIAVLTDLHVGSPFNGVDKLRRVVERTNASRPDIICILGDLVIQGVAGGEFVAPEDIASELKQLRAASGVFGVLGNHDNWLDHDRVAAALETSGVVLVEDTARKVETTAGSVWIAGVSDRWTRAHDIAAALRAVGEDPAPVILITHNPDIFPDVPARVAITLAGHTHGGQVRLPLIGAPIVPSEFGRRYAAGHVIEGGRHLFVSTGIGTSIFPVRFGVPSSITLLTLQ